MAAPDEALLLSPSLQDHPRWTGARAWRPRRLFWVALLGGVVPTAVLAYLNSRRLGLPRSYVRRAILFCAVAVAGWIGLGLQANHPLEGLLFWDRVFALGLYFLLRYSQADGDRAYHFYRGGEWSYASAWRAAAVALVPALAIQALVVALAVG